MTDIRKCEVCGQQFQAAKPWARFCSGRCRTRAYRQAQIDDNSAAALIRVMRHAARTLEQGQGASAALGEVESELKRWRAQQAPPKVERVRRRAVDDRQPSLFNGAGDETPDALLSRFEAALGAEHSGASIARDIGLRDGSTFSRWRAGRRGLSSPTAKRLDSWLAANGF